MENQSLIVTLTSFTLLMLACLAVFHYNMRKLKIKESETSSKKEKSKCCIWDDEDLGFISARILKKSKDGYKVKIDGSKQTRNVKVVYPQNYATSL